MALDTPALKAAIKTAFTQAMTAAQNKDTPQATVQDALAEAIANAIEVYVKSVQITIGTAQIQVTGTAAAQSNPAPLVITNTPPNTIT